MKSIFNTYGKFIVLSIMLLFTVSCGGGGSSSSGNDEPVGAYGTLNYIPETCTDEDQKSFIYEAMHDVYLWSRYTPDLNPDSYSSNTELLNALMYSQDQWSYVIDQETYSNHYSGANIGLGIKTALSTADNEIFVTYVYPGSPADSSPLERGFELISVNGYSAYDIIQNDNWDNAFGPSEEGYAVDITYIDNSNVTGTATIIKDEYTAHSAPVYDIFTNSTNGEKIGYLLYLHFNSNYVSDLRDALTAFRDNDISELILDLRYNGGGQVDTAAYLSTAIAGNSLHMNILSLLIFNSRYTDWNNAVYISVTPYDLAVEKIVYLTTGGSASSSELVIKGLEPYITSYLVGSTTYGKPAGMNRFSFCTDYLVPITFEVFNSEGEGRYYDGIPVDCAENDDITHQLGDSSEYMLENAIHLLENGECLSRSRKAERQLQQQPRKGIQKEINNW